MMKNLITALLATLVLATPLAAQCKPYEDDEMIRWYWHGPYTMTVGQPLHLEGNIEDRDFVHAASEGMMEAIRHLAGQSEQRASNEQRTNKRISSAAIRKPLQNV